LVEILNLSPLLAPNYKQHILSPAKVSEVCYLLAELVIRYVYFEFVRVEGDATFMKLLKGAKVIKVWEPLH
jgi:hypothetical protein